MLNLTSFVRIIPIWPAFWPVSGRPMGGLDLSGTPTSRRLFCDSSIISWRVFIESLSVYCRHFYQKLVRRLRRTQSLEDWMFNYVSSAQLNIMSFWHSSTPLGHPWQEVSKCLECLDRRAQIRVHSTNNHDGPCKLQSLRNYCFIVYV